MTNSAKQHTRAECRPGRRPAMGGTWFAICGQAIAGSTDGGFLTRTDHSGLAHGRDRARRSASAGSANLRRWSCLTVSMIHFLPRKSMRGKAIHPLNLPLSHPVTRRTNVTVTKCCPIGFALGKCGSVASTYLRDGGACVTTRFRALRSASRCVLVNRWRPRRSRSASAESSQ